MEIDNNKNILLVGEANFSFTISLADHFKNRNLITTTCYENLNDLKRIFGETQIENNLALHIVKQEFGEIAKIIAGLLIKKKCCPFQMICKELELEKRLVRDF